LDTQHQPKHDRNSLSHTIKMKKLIIYIIPLLAVIQACETKEQPQEEEVSTSIAVSDLAKNENVKTGSATQQNIGNQIACNGKIHIPPSDNISVHSKTDGYVTQINYLPGEYVKKGATLMRIENPKLIEMQRIFLETKEELDLAEKELARKTALKSENATSERLYEESVSLRNRLSASYKGYKAQLQSIGISTTSLERSASYQQSIAIRAEKSAVVSAVNVNKGQYVTAETLLMQMASAEHLHLELKVFDTDVSQIKLGQSVQFRTANSVDMHNAKVVHINPLLDEKDGGLMIHCHFDRNKEIIAGMYVTATIQGAENKRYSLPISATVKEGDAYYAYQINNDVIVKVQLTNVVKNKDFISSSEIQNTDIQWVIEGAYYVQ